MSAKEMFELLGYVVSDDLMAGTQLKVEGQEPHELHSISAVKMNERWYDEEDEYIEDENEFDFQKRVGKYSATEIFFEYGLIMKNVTIREKILKISIPDDKHIGIEFNGMGAVGQIKSIAKIGIMLMPEEIEAINKQVEELGWNNEK